MKKFERPRCGYEEDKPDSAKNSMELAAKLLPIYQSTNPHYHTEAAALIQSSFEAWGKASAPCPDCGGEGYTAQHDPSMGAHDGEGNCLGLCPVQVQCERCEGTGKIASRPAPTDKKALRDALVSIADWSIDVGYPDDKWQMKKIALRALGLPETTRSARQALSHESPKEQA
jgi:hypothetical protein